MGKVIIKSDEILFLLHHAVVDASVNSIVLE